MFLQHFQVSYRYLFRGISAEHKKALMQHSAENFIGPSKHRCTQMEFYHVKIK